MKFTYETQGAITYLVCELEPAEQVDSLTLGMLTNNHIAGYAPVLYTEMNGQRFLKYNISAKVTCEQFFTGTVNKQRALTAFRNIVNAVCSTDDYMIEPNCIAVEPEHIFLNVSSCETAVVCIPVINDKNINNEVAALFKKLLFSTQFDNNEDASYITHLITYINSGASFNVYGLKDLIEKLQSGAFVTPVAPVQPMVQPSAPAQTPAPDVQQPAVPVSSFDSTISIDDMPAMMAQKQAAKAPVQPQVPNAPVVPPVNQAPVQPQAPKAPVMPPVNAQQAPMAQPPVQHQVPKAPIQPSVNAQQAPMAQPQAVPPMARPVPPVNPVPVQGGRPVQQGGAPVPTPPATKPPMPKAPAQNGPGFAIPGQSKPMAKPPVPGAPVPVPGAPAPSAPAGEKKMSFFGLLANYNKENKELYKKQKAEAKASKAAANGAPRPQQPPVNVPGGAPNAQPPMGRPMGAPAPQPQQQFVPQQVKPPVQPVPVQNSFNETTVLSPAMMSGETTVLSAEPNIANPRLTRTKTGEVVSINKPVFRIGKEKSYVDYFIADNTAISRSHANIHTENGEYFIEDTNSTNHTYINGKLITSNVKTKISNGDKIRLANEDFTFMV